MKEELEEIARICPCCGLPTFDGWECWECNWDMEDGGEPFQVYWERIRQVQMFYAEN